MTEDNYRREYPPAPDQATRERMAEALRKDKELHSATLGYAITEAGVTAILDGLAIYNIEDKTMQLTVDGARRAELRRLNKPAQGNA